MKPAESSENAASAPSEPEFDDVPSARTVERRMFSQEERDIARPEVGAIASRMSWTRKAQSLSGIDRLSQDALS